MVGASVTVSSCLACAPRVPSSPAPSVDGPASPSSKGAVTFVLFLRRLFSAASSLIFTDLSGTLESVVKLVSYTSLTRFLESVRCGFGVGSSSSVSPPKSESSCTGAGLDTRVRVGRAGGMVVVKGQSSTRDDAVKRVARDAYFPTESVSQSQPEN